MEYVKHHMFTISKIQTVGNSKGQMTWVSSITTTTTKKKKNAKGEGEMEGVESKSIKPLYRFKET